MICVRGRLRGTHTTVTAHVIAPGETGAGHIKKNKMASVGSAASSFSPDKMA